MCGVFGYVGRELPDEKILENALDLLSHRGPDQAGIYVDKNEELKLFLGHRRLSILDLSEAGKQPFVTPDGKVAVSVNGEIYNYRELKADLQKKGAVFYSDSDSEVLLWGFYFEGESFFRKMRGMYAAAIWDKRQNSPRLILLRDRLGIKGLYYYWKEEKIIFASELKSIVALPSVQKKISWNAIDHYLVFRYIPSPLSVYEDIYKLSPGQYAVFEEGKCSLNTYWKISVPDEKFSGTVEDAVDELDRLINDAVCEQLVSDVPLGAFLSGGIDSSLICAVAQKYTGTKKLRTFTIGFETAEEDESKYAKEIADYLGTDHTCEVMNKQQLFQILPKLPSLYDEPYADDSAMPTYMLSGVAKKYVTTVLSGDGGDELFFGYNNMPLLWKMGLMDDLLPRFIRKNCGKILHKIFKDGYFGKRGYAVSFDRMDEAYSMISGVFSCKRFKELTGRTFDMSSSPFRQKVKDFEKTVSARYMAPFLDMALYMPDDILCKVDRASMAHALEVRPPLLDHRIVEFANSLPVEYKYNRKEGGKIVLKKVLERYIPRHLWERPKQGFGTPVDSWFRKELKEDSARLLHPGKLRNEWGFFPEYVHKILQEHWDNKMDNRYLLWCLYELSIWRENNCFLSK